METVLILILCGILSSAAAAKGSDAHRVDYYKYYWALKPESNHSITCSDIERDPGCKSRKFVEDAGCSGPDHTVTQDGSMCNCYVCGKFEGEICGGYYNTNGICGADLVCAHEIIRYDRFSADIMTKIDAPNGKCIGMCNIK
jgi:hypothetical protein